MAAARVAPSWLGLDGPASRCSEGRPLGFGWDDVADVRRWAVEEGVSNAVWQGQTAVVGYSAARGVSSEGRGPGIASPAHHHRFRRHHTTHAPRHRHHPLRGALGRAAPTAARPVRDSVSPPSATSMAMDLMIRDRARRPSHRGGAARLGERQRQHRPTWSSAPSRPAMETSIGPLSTLPVSVSATSGSSATPPP